MNYYNIIIMNTCIMRIMMYLLLTGERCWGEQSTAARHSDITVTRWHNLEKRCRYCLVHESCVVVVGTRQSPVITHRVILRLDQIFLFYLFFFNFFVRSFFLCCRAIIYIWTNTIIFICIASTAFKRTNNRLSVSTSCRFMIEREMFIVP